jgi:uncharacterized membrane protein HdeD (DUF308 family)
MLQSMARSWWVWLLRGIAAIVFGIIAFVSPAATLLALVIVFGIYAIFDGVLAVVTAFQIREVAKHWWVVLLEGLAGILFGIIALVYPLITAGALLLLIAFWAVVTGIMEIIAAIRLRREITNEWSLILTGIFSVILGVMLFVFPGAGLALVWTIGLYAVFFGVLMIIFGFEVRSLARQLAN